MRWESTNKCWFYFEQEQEEEEEGENIENYMNTILSFKSITQKCSLPLPPQSSYSFKARSQSCFLFI